MADCTIESDMELRIPAEYVPQEGERISLYQELDNMERLSDVEAFRERLCDRFGAIPRVTQELILIVSVSKSSISNRAKCFYTLSMRRIRRTIILRHSVA